MIQETVSRADERPSRAEARNEDELFTDFSGIVRKIWFRKWLLLAFVLVAGLIGYVTTNRSVPHFEANAKLIIDAPGERIIDVGALVAQDTERDLQNEVEILQSTVLVDSIIDRTGLADDPEFNPRLREARDESGAGTAADRSGDGIFQAVQAFLANASLQRSETLEPRIEPEPEQSQEDQRLERRILISNVLGNLDFEIIPNSRVIEISFVSEFPDKAARVANAFAEEYISYQLTSKREATRAATEWLSGRVEELAVRIREAEGAVETARIAQSEGSGQSPEITQQQLQSLTALLTEVRGRTRNAEARYERLRSTVQKENIEFGAIPEFRNADVMRDYRQTQADLLMQRAERLTFSQGDNPDVRRIDSQLAAIDMGLREEAERIVDAARSEWESLEAELGEIAAEVEKMEARALEQSRADVTIRQLEREADATRRLYENFLTRMNETSEQERLQGPDARVLTYAEPPLWPMSDVNNKTLLVSIILGALAGLVTIFILDRWNSVVFKTPRELEEFTGLDVLGTIPKISRFRRAAKLVRSISKSPNSALAETVRSLRTGILQSMGGRSPQVIMFTSSVPGEGKSTAAILMAMTSAQVSGSVIFLDCDLRKPSAGRFVRSTRDQPGLLSVLNGSAGLSDAIFYDPETGIAILSAKPHEVGTGANAADILSSDGFRDMVHALRETYDTIIIDSAPLLVVADARIVATMVDAVVFIVQWNRTPKGAVADGLKLLRSMKAPLVGMILTAVNEKKAQRASYRRGDGYSRKKFTDYYLSR